MSTDNDDKKPPSNITRLPLKPRVVSRNNDNEIIPPELKCKLPSQYEIHFVWEDGDFCVLTWDTLHIMTDTGIEFAVSHLTTSLKYMLNKYPNSRKKLKKELAKIISGISQLEKVVDEK